MSFLESLERCYGQWGDVGGRASRTEYWHFVLFTILATAALIYTFYDFHLGKSPFAPYAPYFLYAAFFAVPFFSLTIRRFHDIGYSGWWWLLLNLIPAIGHIIIFILMFFKGNQEDNRFGKSPYLHKK